MLYENHINEAIAIYEQVEKMCGGNESKIMTITLATIALNQKQTMVRYLYELRCALTNNKKPTKKKNETVSHQAG